MRKAKRHRLRSLIEFLAGIIVVVGAIGFYQLGKSVIGPYLRSRVSSAVSTVATDTTALSHEAASQMFVRSDMAFIPDETTVTIEPIQAPAAESEQPQTQSETAPSETTSETPHEIAPEVTREGERQIQPPETEGARPTSPQATAKPAPAERTPQPEKPRGAEATAPRPTTGGAAVEQPSPEVGITGVPAESTKRRYQVQVGLFKQKENTDKLVQELMRRGYQPSVEVSKSLTGEIRYRVIVGAFDDRNDAERLAQELKEIGVEAIVRDAKER